MEVLTASLLLRGLTVWLGMDLFREKGLRRPGSSLLLLKELLLALSELVEHLSTSARLTTLFLFTEGRTGGLAEGGLVRSGRSGSHLDLVLGFCT